MKQTGGPAITRHAYYLELPRNGACLSVYAGPSAEIEVAQGGNALDAVASTWAGMEAAFGVSSPFQSLALARVAAKAHIRAGEIPRIAVVRKNGRPLVIFPTVVSRFSGVTTVRFLGDPLIQYGDVIAAPEASVEQLEAAWSAIADPAAASAVLLRKVRADAKIAPLMTKVASRLSATEAPFVDLRQGDQRRHKHARELQRLRRRLAERGDVQLEIVRGSAVGPVLRDVIDLKKAWLAERRLPSLVFGNPNWEGVLVELVGKECGGPEMVAARLTVGGAVAAIEIGFADARSWFAYIGALAPDFAAVGPGHIQTADTIAYCREMGLARYDLLPPSQPYKRVLATGAVPVCDYGVALAVSGHLAVLAERLVPKAKVVIGAMPSQLRSFVLQHFRSINKV
jgi:CelD/BcsL family acetyltransferase involved in cellulose biosynthesis